MGKTFKKKDLKEYIEEEETIRQLIKLLNLKVHLKIMLEKPHKVLVLTTLGVVLFMVDITL
jgi:hypothetical protein